MGSYWYKRRGKIIKFFFFLCSVDFGPSFYEINFMIGSWSVAVIPLACSTDSSSSINNDRSGEAARSKKPTVLAAKRLVITNDLQNLLPCMLQTSGDNG